MQNHRAPLWLILAVLLLDLASRLLPLEKTEFGKGLGAVALLASGVILLILLIQGLKCGFAWLKSKA